MLKQSKTKNARKQGRGERSPRGQISCVVRQSKQEGQPGSIRINVPGTLRKSRQQEVFLLGLPATHQNYAAVQGALEKINARIYLVQDLNVEDMSKQELKNLILGLLGKAEQPKAEFSAGVALDTLILEYIDYARSVLKYSEGTVSVYITAYNVVTRLAKKEISDANTIIVELAKLEYGAYYRTLQKIALCCTWAVEQEKILKNPFLVTLRRLKEPPLSDKHPDPFSRQAMERIIEAYRHDPRCSYYADLVEFYFLTGVRTGEAVALRWGDIDFEKGVIRIRKTIAIVRGKHEPRDKAKTRDRDFPIEDPALERLLRKLWASGKKADDFVFQEPNGNHVDRSRFYYSWHGKNRRDTSAGGTRERQFNQGIVSELAALGEEKGGIDHYRPQYNTRHTFISMAAEGLIELNGSTMRDLTTLAVYVGNSAEVILKHYLGGSGKRQMVVVSLDHEKFGVSSTVNKENTKDNLVQAQKVIELERYNSRLQTALQSLVQFINAALLQFVPEAFHSQLSGLVAKLVGNDLPNPTAHSSESINTLDEEIAQCTALLTIESNSNS